MDRWSWSYIRWKLLAGLFLPLGFVALLWFAKDLYLALTALFFFGVTTVVVYLFAAYTNELL